MILPFVSLALAIYAFVRFVWPLTWRPVFKWLTGALCLLVSAKYLIYKWMGGAFFAPELPRPLLFCLECGYAALIFLVLLLIMRDAILILLWLLRRCGVSWRIPFTISRQNSLLVCTALVLAVHGVWMSVRVPPVHTVEISLKNLPAQLDGFSLIQLSDLHIGTLLQDAWLQKVVQKVNEQQPQLIVLTGDLIDGYAPTMKKQVQPLRDLHADYGVYGVTGNHEYYHDADAWTAVFTALGVRMLHNTHAVITVAGAPLVICGVPDFKARAFRNSAPDITAALQNAPQGTRILLAHQPRAAKHSQGVQLQLSGHTHGGVLFFLRSVVGMFNDGFVCGVYQLADKILYVSPGTGVWSGFSCRLGVPSEITRIVLRRA